MKGLLIQALIVTSLSVFAFTAANAASDSSKMDSKKMAKSMWTCETNASSADSMDMKNADKMMENKPKSASAAFSYAYKHCRDCTKITCSMENK